ncbi:MAG: PTS glucose transporter subunit IIA, partial [Solobacterium sp.]|nr:PTS glucose transporter subunit IIA [Solobacterium sp.]
MFRLFGKKERGSFIVSPVNGTAIDISMVNDPVFSQKMMGDGIAFELKEEKAVICAPADGVLSVLFPTGHAFGVTADNGAELLVHIGINTVESEGKGFRVLS